MHLHEDIEIFKEIIAATSYDMHDKDFAVIEKDYYVTEILRLLAQKAPNCVFKGGTSLSKCHKVINRFSEDIDISCANILSQGQRKKLKNDIIAGISNELKMPIPNWNETRSRRDYNCYIFDYTPINGFVKESLIPGVKMEVVLSSLAFPTVKLEVSSFIYEFLKKENFELIEKFNLQPFKINVQDLDRTFVDKVFAICDYYIQGKTERNSRHIYDLYMIRPKLHFDNNLKTLIKEVRNQRMKLPFCLSAKPGVDINSCLKKIVYEGFYRSDYGNLTAIFQDEPRVFYDEAIRVIEEIRNSNIFEE
ncbi:MAG: nucleotidyl transferase AbiEii/AbiGii toxin family protein [Phascolarctobacterium sp.]|nr:nucleotidyl transferase AbiEii/AbiGii toxin family protein [Phascolarctobacterium sp.]